MSIPGFSADSGLYRSKIPYAMSFGGGAPSGDLGLAADLPGRVVPSITVIDRLGIGGGFGEIVPFYGDYSGGVTLGGGGDVVAIPPPPICGRAGQRCCPGGGCFPNLVCNENGICRTPCGDPGQRCCQGGRCNDDKLSCNANGICRQCGGNQDICCTSGTPCRDGLSCIGGRCQACGGVNQSCCNGLCNQENLLCANGKCIPCGYLGIPCCRGLTGGLCFEGRCDITQGICLP